MRSEFDLATFGQPDSRFVPPPLPAEETLLQDAYRQIPSVDQILGSPSIRSLLESEPRPVVVVVCREVGIVRPHRLKECD